MKVIDLLNKIANGEEVPKKIKFYNNVYKYHGKEYGYCRHYYDNTYIYLTSEYNFFDILNDEVEIIEEKKLPEKLGKIEDNYGYIDQYDIIKIGKKVDKIINYLESKEKGE